MGIFLIKMKLYCIIIFLYLSVYGFFIFSEFDKYQISVNAKRPAQQSSNQLPAHRNIGDQTQQTTTPITFTRPRDGDGSNSGGSTQWCDVSDSQLLQPGRTYQVLVKTVSGKVASWPASVNVTLSMYK